MSDRVRAITVFGLLSLLLFFGCSNQSVENHAGSTSTNTTGSVTEFVIAFPGSVKKIAALSCSRDGIVVYALTGGDLPNSSSEDKALDMRAILWATEDQGTTWEPVFGLPDEVDDAFIIAGAISADGDCIIAKLSNEVHVQLNESGMPGLDFFFIGRDGDYFEVDYDFSLVDTVNISFVARDRALIFDYTNAFLVDTVSGEVVAKYDTANDLVLHRTIKNLTIAPPAAIVCDEELHHDGRRRSGICYSGTARSH